MSGNSEPSSSSRPGETSRPRSPYRHSRGASSPATSRRVGGTLDEATRTTKARVVVDNPGGLLRRGMFARVRLLLEAGSTASRSPRRPSSTTRGVVRLRAREGPYFVRRPVDRGPSLWPVGRRSSVGSRPATRRHARRLPAQVRRAALEDGRRLRGLTEGSAMTTSSTWLAEAPVRGALRRASWSRWAGSSPGRGCRSTPFPTSPTSR